tara:strand:+ start:1393 stop:1575 length:183 start_codon:yes stop_codon:yes gene_type:complete
MNNIIKKVKNGGFEVVSTSYGNPVVYDNDRRVQSGMERKRNPNNATGYCFKYGIYRSNGD